MKLKRQSKIIELVKNNDIETQEELAESLKDCGYQVTQATISRDIRELKLTKILTDNGKQKYVVMSNNEGKMDERLIRVFKDGMVSMDYAQNILVIKTLVGMGMAVGAALDAMNKTEIIGTIGGDDTLICILKTEEKAIRLMEKLRNVSSN